jgi:RimJ/RimL family protein N-acetyltransferase
MERMPFQPTPSSAEALGTPSAVTTTTSDWQHLLPLLSSARVTLREMRSDDAPSLLAMVSTEEVSRFISPPPTTVEGFERFIAWAIRERESGNYVCFAVVPDGMSTPVGLFQLRALEAGFATAEWGFAIGSGFWGTGVFVESARLVLDFAFDTLGVHRLEARASLANGRGNGALRKIGAVQEGVLRRSFFRGGVFHDQALWSILADDWHIQRANHGPRVH